MALFVALGGGVAWAAQLGKGDVNSKIIKNNSVKGADLRNNGATGTDIDEATLGKVPSAASADSAATAGSASTANSANSADTANTAGSASTAGNSDLLDGIDSAAFGRVARGGAGTAVLNVGTDTQYTTEASATIRSGSKAGFVLVVGTISAYTVDEANCPCQVQARLRDPTNATSQPMFGNVPATADADGLATDSVSVQHVFPIPAETTHQYDLEVVIDDTNATNMNGAADIVALYVPFGATGGETLARTGGGGDSFGDGPPGGAAPPLP